MALTQERRAGEKRGPGRPPKHANTGTGAVTPTVKRLKSASAPTTPQDLASSSPPPTTTERPTPRLPYRVTDNRPIPALPRAQSPALPEDEYQSIAASAVLAAALDRSRIQWTHHGILEKYWVKPETGKNARPPPPNNPEVKWQKSKGECRIRLEPHVFTADVYVEERPKTAQSKQSPAYPMQSKPLPLQDKPQQSTSGKHIQHGSHAGSPPLGAPQQPVQRLTPSSTTLQSQDKKASPDPVISMLASRASSNPELKRLMKEVATGDANPEQLRVFQEHIDELTEIIKKRKRDEQEQVANKNRDKGAPGLSTPQSAVMLGPPSSQPPTTQLGLYSQQPSPLLYHPQQPLWTAPDPPSRPPLILAFKDLGSGEDRFLFPQMSILEPLSPQHELVSFLVIKKGHEAAHPASFEHDQEYWQPVTMMVEVAYGREEILSCIRRWVKPPDEVRKYMKDVMQKFQKAPAAHVAFRLPFKGSALVESEEPSKEATPAVEEKAKVKSSVKYVKKAMMSGQTTPLLATPRTAVNASAAGTPKPTTEPNIAPAAPEPERSGDVSAPKDGSGATDPNATDSRPRRTLRKSVRIEA